MLLRNMTSVYFIRSDGLLCLYRMGSRVANNKYVGAAGGHFEREELNDPTACVLREMGEELGLKPADIEGLRLRYITLRRMAGEVRQNYYFFAKLKVDRPLESTEGQLRWVAWEEFADLPMPVTARAMLLHYREVGRFDDILYGGLTGEDTTHFVPLTEFEG